MTQTELTFEEPRTNQSARILAYFKSGGKLTVLSAINLLGVYALSQRCGNLRKLGHDIQSETIKLPNGKHVKEYRLG